MAQEDMISPDLTGEGSEQQELYWDTWEEGFLGKEGLDRYLKKHPERQKDILYIGNFSASQKKVSKGIF